MFTLSEIDLLKTLTYWAGMLLVLLSATVLPMLETWRSGDRERHLGKPRRERKRVPRQVGGGTDH
jgi:hypothetical protein